VPVPLSGDALTFPPIFLRLSLAGTALAALPAVAQVAPRTQFTVQLSQDGVDWTSNLNLTASPTFNGRLFARVLVRYIRNDGPFYPFLNSVRSQPTVDNWNATLDTVLPIEPRNRVNPEYDSTPLLGRTFGATTVGTADALAAPVNGTTLRYAALTVTNAIGTGSGTNNIDGGRGINTTFNAIGFQPFGDIRLFTFGFDTAPNQPLRTLTFDVPYLGIKRFVPADEASQRGADWVISNSPFTVVRADALPTITATLTVPGPAPLAVLLLGLARGRPNRRHS